MNWLRVCASLPGARLVGVCDHDSRRLSEAPVDPDVRRFASFERALREPSAEAVVLATPAGTHAELALQALASEKWVLVEKPLATRVADAERVASAAAGRVMAGHLLCYHPAVVAARAAMQRGELGAVTHVRCERPGTPVRPEEGGAWWAFAPHDIAVLRWLFGGEPRTVHAAPNGGAVPEDCMTAWLGFDGGRLGVIRVGGPASGNRRRITVVGERRSLALTDGAGVARLALYETRRGSFDDPASPVFQVEPVSQHIVSGEEPLRAQARHFVDAVRAGKPFRTGAEDGLAVVRILARGSEAARRRARQRAS